MGSGCGPTDTKPYTPRTLNPKRPKPENADIQRLEIPRLETSAFRGVNCPGRGFCLSYGCLGLVYV